MKTPYQELFDEVRASPGLKEEVLNMTKQERTKVVRKLSMSFVIAAALAAVLAGTALAAVIGVPETLQDWFGQQWTEAGDGEMPEEQSAVIDRLVQSVDVTAINKGVSVTLDSVTPGEGGLWLMLKVKGDVLTEEQVHRWNFQGYNLTGGPMEKEVVDESASAIIRSATIREVGVTEDGTQVILLFYDAPRGVDFLEGGDLELRMRNIALWGAPTEEEGPIPLVETLEAKWVLPFTLVPTEDLEVLTVERALVPCDYIAYASEAQPGSIEITDIRITAIGISFLEPAWEDGGERNYVISDVALRLKDGMEIPADSGYMGAMNAGEALRRSWELPVDLSRVEAVRFGDVVIPLEP